jgi:hypothetical protein
MGSVSFLVHLTPKDAAGQLQSRAEAIERAIEALDAALEKLHAHVDRVHVIELEYLVAMLKAEGEWVRKLIGELRSGRFTWDLEKILRKVRAARRKAAPRKERKA